MRVRLHVRRYVAQLDVVLMMVVLAPVLLLRIVGRITDGMVSMVVLMSVLLLRVTGRVCDVMVSVVAVMSVLLCTALHGSPTCRSAWSC